MPLITFPDPRSTTPEGLVAVGGSLNRQTLKAAYAKGIFPWPQEGLPMLWFCPPQRGVLDFGELRIPQSLAKALKRSAREGIEYRWNFNFELIINQCSSRPRKGQLGTWITREVVDAYVDLFKHGEAWCMGAYREQEIVGGIYGVQLSGYITAESMFYKESDQSKICLLKSVERFSNLGFSWVDVQMVTDVTQSLGAKLVDRDDFLSRISV